MTRYTCYGSTQLETTIDHHLTLIRERVIEYLGDQLDTLILCGGYGRGEGAVCIIDGQESVFNDYDLFVISKNMSRSKRKECRTLLSKAARELTKEIGIEVDLFLLTRAAFAKQPFTLMNYEMKKKSVIIYGDRNILDELPDYDEYIPLIEGTRLLLNRGILLLYCKRLFIKNDRIDEEQRRIMIKYIIKAILAMGDSYLIITGQYDYSYLKKADTFRSIVESDYQLFDEMVDAYIDAIDFKLKANYDLHRETNIATWLFHTISIYETYLYWFEEKRLNIQISNWESYKESIISSAGSLPVRDKLKNFLINIREFGIIKTFKDYEFIFSYPRDRLYILLTFSLFRYDVEAFSQADIIAFEHITDLDSLVDRFWTIWLKYS